MQFAGDQQATQTANVLDIAFEQAAVVQKPLLVRVGFSFYLPVSKYYQLWPGQYWKARLTTREDAYAYRDVVRLLFDLVRGHGVGAVLVMLRELLERVGPGTGTPPGDEDLSEDTDALEPSSVE